MLRCLWLVAVLLSLTSLGGCRCCGCLEHVADVIDDIGDTDVLFDQWYHPRLDVSRAGKPDWCGPINQRLCPCRCFLGRWNRYNDCWLYPPSHPYWYPGTAFAEPTEKPEVPPASEPASPAEEAMPPLPVPPVPMRQGLEAAPPSELKPLPPPEPSAPTSPLDGWRPRQTERR